MEIPYLPKNRQIKYVSADNIFMKEAEKFAKKYSSDEKTKTGAVIVKNGKIIGKGANYSWWHKIFFCVRQFLKIKTGKSYWVCFGCNPKFHAEAQAIKNSRKKEYDLSGSDLYLWGHWWCCKNCWDKIIKHKIKNVYLSKNKF